MAREVHIAGMAVQVGSEYRQRCAWCGVALIEGDAAQEMVAPGSGADTSIKYFGQNELVEIVKEGQWMMRNVVPHEDGASVPRDCCAAKPLKLTLVTGG